MNSLLDSKYLMFGKIGSFWAEKMRGKSREFVKSLISFSRLTNMPDTLIESMRNLNNDEHVLATNLVVSFNPKQVAILGPDVQKRVVTVYSAESVQELFINRPAAEVVELLEPLGITLSQSAEAAINSGSSNYLTLSVTESDLNPDVYTMTEQDILLTKYIVTFPKDTTALQIQLPNRVLIAGIDFEQGQGVLIFNENPSALFPTHKIFVKTAIKTVDNLFNYSLAVEPVRGSIEKISEYYRYSQSTKTFKLALARACGFYVFEKDSLLLRVSGNYFKRVYEFDTGTITIEYPHDTLEVGTTYFSGTVLGDIVDVIGQSNAYDVNWYQKLDWSEGIDLSILGPYPGVKIPHGFISAERPTGSQHVRLYVEGTQAAKENYWQQCALGELSSNIYLKDLVELDSIAEGETKQVNAIELFFKYFLSEKCWVIKTKGYAYWSTELKNRYNQFVTREKPFGAVILKQDVPITIPYGAGNMLYFDVIPNSMYLPLIS